VAVVASRTEAELIVGLLGSHDLRAAVAADDAGGQEPQPGRSATTKSGIRAKAPQVLLEGAPTPSYPAALVATRGPAT